MATPRTTSSAGTIFSLAAGAPATFDATGFAAQTYLPIGKVTNASEFGKTFQLIKSQYLTQRGEEKRKGTFDAGQMMLDMDLIAGTGQDLCLAALDSDADYSLLITRQNGDKYYLRVLVTKFTIKVGGPNNMTSAHTTMELQTMILASGAEVNAVAVYAP